jgi:hypothetical protein
MICWPGSTDTPPITRKNPPPRWQLDQPPKDFRTRPLSHVENDVFSALSAEERKTLYHLLSRTVGGQHLPCDTEGDQTLPGLA